MSNYLPEGKEDELDIFLKIYSELAHKARGGAYIYRGEHREFGKISSSLYRLDEETDEQGLGTEAVEKAILEQAKTHEPELVN